MKYLLDSHILIWALYSDEKLSIAARDIINDFKNEIYYSVVSVWEIGLKHSKKPEMMPVSSDDLVKYCESSGMLCLPIVKEHVLTLQSLHLQANVPPHSDPFDRMLIAQAKSEEMRLLTHDHLLKNYSEPCVETV